MYCRATGKFRHPTRHKAQAHLVGLKVRMAYRGCVFRCGACGGFHVGKSPPDRRKNVG